MISSLVRWRSERAQTVIEYSAVAILVIVGILVMGPYVIRSINAYFMSAEEQTQDSLREEIRQAAITPGEDSIPMDGCACNYSGLTCGNGTHCPLTQKMQLSVCTPSTCSPTQPTICSIEALREGAKIWADCRALPGVNQYPFREGEYEDWTDGTWSEGVPCGYECCEDELLADTECHFLDSEGNPVPDYQLVNVKYKGHPHNAAHDPEWNLHIGDMVLNDEDNKIYIVTNLIEEDTDGIIGNWKFEGDFVDSIGDNDGTSLGSSIFSEGSCGQAADFVSGPGPVYLSKDSTVFDFTDGFTLEMWIKIPDNQMRHPIWIGANSDQIKTKIGFFFYDNRWYLLSLDSADADLNLATAVATPADGQWHHVVGTYDPSSLTYRLYYDGGSPSSLVSPNALSDKFNSVWLWGNGYVDEDGNFASVVSSPSGYLDEVAIYNWAIPDDAIKNRFQYGPPGCQSEWDGDRVEWDEWQQPEEHWVVHVEESGENWEYDGANWVLFTEEIGQGYIKKMKPCGPQRVGQTFYEQSNRCFNRCIGDKDPKATWCPEYNIDLMSNASVTHVSYEEGCLAVGKCTAYCPDDKNIDVSPEGCVCKGWLTWDGDSCECESPNRVVIGTCTYERTCTSLQNRSYSCGPWSATPAGVVSSCSGPTVEESFVCPGGWVDLEIHETTGRPRHGGPIQTYIKKGCLPS